MANKYLGKAPRGKKLAKMSMFTALSLAYECYMKKIIDDEHAEPRALSAYDSLADSVKFFILQRFGLQSMAENYTYGLVEALQRLARKSARLRHFGIMTGILDPDNYSPRYSSIFLHLLKLVYPTFSLTTLRTRKEGKTFIPVERAIHAATIVFVDHSLGVSRDKLMLTSNRKNNLIASINAAGEPYSQAFIRATAAEAGATTERESMSGHRARSADKDEDDDDGPATSVDDKDSKVEVRHMNMSCI
jgi:hypothetical protein